MAEQRSEGEPQRYWEIDFARGVAVITMVVFHFFFDAQYFNKIHLEGGFWDYFWYYFPRVIGGMFIFISGFSMSLSFKKSHDFREFVRKRAKRAGEFALIASLITLSTYIFSREEVVLFGIIHFFTLATIFGIFFSGKPVFSFLTGIALFFTGVCLQKVRFHVSFLFWLGFIPYNFTTLDYYPLLPWFGVFLLGLSAGNFHKRQKDVNFLFRSQIVKLGRNSLKIYLVQHPVIIFILQLWYGDVFQTILQRTSL